MTVAMMVTGYSIVTRYLMVIADARARVVVDTRVRVVADTRVRVVAVS